MPEKDRLNINTYAPKKNVRLVKQVLAALFTIFSAAALLLIFEIGRRYWPAWMVLNRNQILAIILFILVFFLLLYPLIVEFTKDPRMLSGPGRNPQGPNLP